MDNLGHPLEPLMGPYSRYSPEPMDLDDTSNFSPLPESQTPLPPTRIRRLTERAKAMLEDELPEGTGELLSDEDSQAPSQSSEELPPSTLRIRIRRMVKTAVNKFGLIRTYHGRPSGVPKLQKSDFLVDDLQPAQAPESTSPPKKKSVKDIIHPYPNLSSFLFN